MDNLILNRLKEPEIWDKIMDKFLKSESFSADQKFSLSIMKKQKFYLEVVDRIVDETYEWSIPKRVEIPKGDGGFRLVYIHSLKDRFLLSALNNIFSEVYSDRVSKYVYSYKEGVKTLSAVNSIIKDLEVFDKYSLKLDISKYFNSVSESSLRGVVKEITNESSPLRTLLTKLLFTNKVINKNKVEKEYMSLIPGCAFSSFLANYTLKDLDTRLGETENVTYARYSDDMIFFSESEKRLKDLNEIVLTELELYGLKINPSKYVYYNPGDKLEFLGLSIYRESNGRPCIDIKKSGTKKIKRYIKSEVKRRRKKIEIRGSKPEVELAKFFYRLNSKLYKTFIYNPNSFGWGYYVFSNINTIESLRELDFYLKERSRYLFTGKNNKYNIKRISDEKLHELGMKSFVHMYITFKSDFDFYKSEIRDIERVRVYFNPTESSAETEVEGIDHDHTDYEDTDYEDIDYEDIYY